MAAICACTPIGGGSKINTIFLNILAQTGLENYPSEKNLNQILRAQEIASNEYLDHFRDHRG